MGSFALFLIKLSQLPQKRGMKKPDLRIFRLALEQAGCNPQNTIMVGDRLANDIVPARQLGMKTIWVRQGFAKYQSVEKKEYENQIIS